MKNSKLTQRVKAHTDSFTSPKLAKYLAFLAIFFSTTQLSFHIFLKDSYLYSIPIDYLAPALYFFDIFAIFASLYFHLSKASYLKKFMRLLSPLILILFLNTLTSSFSLISLSWSLRIIIYCILALYITRLNISATLSKAIIFTATFHLILSTLQMVSSSSLGGPLYWLGERFINLISPNVAKTSIFGETVLRPYSTFSHPNVLAGWLIASLIYVTMTGFGVVKTKALALIPHYALLFLSLSRAALFSLLLFPLRKVRAHAPLRLVVLIFSILILVLSRSTLLRDSSSLSSRLDLTTASLTLISQKPIFGTGLNSALVLYDDHLPQLKLLQPDHNTFTLLFSYFGLSLLSLLFFYKTMRIFLVKDLLPLLPLLLLDHYFITAPQTLFMLILLLVTIYAKNNNST